MIGTVRPTRKYFPKEQLLTMTAQTARGTMDVLSTQTTEYIYSLQVKIWIFDSFNLS